MTPAANTDGARRRAERGSGPPTRADVRQPTARLSSPPSNGLDGGSPRTGSVGDRALIIRASRGDVNAFSKLVQAHSDLVYQRALRMLGSEDAQDASQEVWVKVWANIRSFRGESAFSTWLYRITVNTCLSLQRRESRRKEREVEEETPHLPEAPGEGDPEAAVLNSERREEVHVALGNVREDHRAALILRHMEGLSYAEIAEVLNVPDGTAKGWVSRGRAAMLVTLTQRERPPGAAGQGDPDPGERGRIGKPSPSV